MHTVLRTDTQRIPVIDGELSDATRKIRPGSPLPPVPRQPVRLTRRGKFVRDVAVGVLSFVIGVAFLKGGLDLRDAMNAWAETWPVLP